MILHGFHRSSSSWRVRIALNLKAIEFQNISYRLRAKEQHTSEYRKKNPQLFVPTLEFDNGKMLTQSVAIIEYLDEIYPTPPLLPSDPIARVQVRAMAQIIACDIHPIQNLKILQRISHLDPRDDSAKLWATQIISEGFDAIETVLKKQTGVFCFGNNPTLADICLVPQVGNARRFGVDLKWPKIKAITEACEALPEFIAASPQNQIDAA